MTQRIGPRDGYDFGNKRQYRRDVWSALASFVRTERPLSEAHAMLMPSIEGDEIEVALTKGFRQNNLHIVDMNPAIVATLKRRYPLVRTYGVDVAIAAFRIADAGVKLACANLDLCSCLSAKMWETVAHVAVSGAFLERNAIAITMLRGREQSETTKLLRETSIINSDGLPDSLTDRDASRLATIQEALATHGGLVKLIRAGTYRSTAGSQTMLWTAFIRHPYLCPCHCCLDQMRNSLRTGARVYAHMIGLRKGRNVEWYQHDAQERIRTVRPLP